MVEVKRSYCFRLIKMIEEKFGFTNRLKPSTVLKNDKVPVNDFRILVSGVYI